MAKNKSEQPALYAMVHPGLEAIAAEEIAETLGGEVKKSGLGIVVFRLADIDRDVLNLRTTEDVFLLAWGTDELSYRAVDLERMRRWTDKDADWARLLQIHHGIRPKPKGRPTYRLVVQKSGTHAYRRVDARKALARGLTGKLPASWNHAEENAAVEIWLTIQGATAICGLRLSDRSMRHRTYKVEHFPASLRPTLAAAMVRLADLKPMQTILDPLCGAGTILAEAALATRGRHLHSVGGEGSHSLPSPWGRGVGGEGPGGWNLTLLGGDIEPRHVHFAEANLRKLASVQLSTWDARDLPLEGASVDRIICNPPFGKQLSSPGEIGPLYRALVREWDRALKKRGRVVVLVAEASEIKGAAQSAGWRQLRQVGVRILGQRAVILVYRKD
ncbi:MAG: RNA methyltransferase [Gemmataceae bacterium]|nr:RNA methyltransferase [Gemmataceae bacterium]